MKIIKCESCGSNKISMKRSMLHGNHWECDYCGCIYEQERSDVGNLGTYRQDIYSIMNSNIGVPDYQPFVTYTTKYAE